MAYDYLADKLSIYVLDDRGSALTLFAFMEAAKLASWWLPFCREHNVMERSPDVYFEANSHSEDVGKLRNQLVWSASAGSMGSPDGHLARSTKLTVSPFTVAVGSIQWPIRLKGFNQQNSPNSNPSEPQGEKDDFLCVGHQEVMDKLWWKIGCKEGGHRAKNFSQQNGISPDMYKREEVPSSIHDRCFKSHDPPEFAFQNLVELNMSATFSMPEALVATECQEPFESLLVEGAGSSKDFRNLCPSTAEIGIDEMPPPYSDYRLKQSTAKRQMKCNH
ncbi:hypothetical protein F3Y22_tig00116971pilonHSYRG00750 [Hibiscus syriacus]|uniref:Uncharacterized protein n=1 Tax=Hibiscus syriacus TaxID=106335 RepID=A0A6A2XQ96_HIBSY|nr:hypothetical protein F3Y22_tig00116971pilonHSYRG00750 [Hibiscus syriacus]